MTMAKADFRVWWNPQLGMPSESFKFPVPTMETGAMLCEALAKYDLYQLANNIKPDFANMGGVQWRHAELTEGEWWDIDMEDADEVEYVREHLAELA